MKFYRSIVSVCLLGLILIACGAASSPIKRTVIHLKFPFEPSFPGYIVDITSQDFTKNLACGLDRDGKTGTIIDLDQPIDPNHPEQVDAAALGVCDTSSMTLNVPLEGEITVTGILGGFPIIYEVTKSPDQITVIKDDPTCSNCRQTEYSFETGGFPK